MVYFNSQLDRVHLLARGIVGTVEDIKNLKKTGPTPTEDPVVFEQRIDHLENNVRDLIVKLYNI